MDYDASSNKLNVKETANFAMSNDLNESNQIRENALSEGEVLRIELHEDVPKINRENVVREKVQIKKFLTQEPPGSNQ